MSIHISYSTMLHYYIEYSHCVNHYSDIYIYKITFICVNSIKQWSSNTFHNVLTFVILVID